MVSENTLLIALAAVTVPLSALAVRARYRKSEFTPHLSIASGVMAFLFFANLPARFSPALVAAGFAFVAGFLMLLRRQDERPRELENASQPNIVRILPPESYLSETGSWRLRNPEEYLSRSGVWRLNRREQRQQKRG